MATTTDFLFLVNGTDDNADGYVDNGWDGVDNDGQNGIDDIGEWTEREAWITTPSQSPLPYTITRRPVPTTNAREIQLPSNIVIDATTLGTTNERTRVPPPALNPFTGVVDIMINPDGSILPTTLYSSPSSVSMNGAFYHLWIAERSDVVAAVGTTVPTLPIGRIAGVWIFPPGLEPFQGGVPSPYSGPVMKSGQYFVISLSAKTGATITVEQPQFDNPQTPISIPFGLGYQPNLQYQEGQDMCVTGR